MRTSGRAKKVDYAALANEGIRSPSPEPAVTRIKRPAQPRKPKVKQEVKQEPLDLTMPEVAQADVKPDIKPDEDALDEAVNPNLLLPPEIISSDDDQEEVQENSEQESNANGRPKRRASLKRRRKAADSEGEDFQVVDKDSDYESDGTKKRKRPKAKKRKTPDSDESEDELGPKPPPTHPSTWRESDLDDDATITKTEGSWKYQLYNIEMERIRYRPHTTRAGYEAKIYREIEVERLAWTIHGSPEGHDWHVQDRERKRRKRRERREAKGFVSRYSRRIGRVRTLSQREIGTRFDQY